MRISRTDKKKLRAILLCHTGNYKCRKTKISKKIWIQIKREYKIWLSYFSMNEYKSANSIKQKTK